MQQPKRIYTNGGPVQVGGGLYIERKADHDLLRHCRDGKYVFVLSSRQVGKSSLMNNVARQLNEEGTESVILDLQGIGTVITSAQWYQGLLTRIERKFRLDLSVADWWEERQHLGDAHRFMLFLQDELLVHLPEPKRIVIFIDEIDTTLSLRFSDDFFAALRAMYHARDGASGFDRLSFVLIGVATPTDLIDDPRRTPFNISESVALTDFTFAEAWPLAEGFALPDEEARKVLGWALKWTSGHPFLTQQLCRAVAEQNNSHWTESELDALVEQTFFGAQAEQNIHLKAVRDLLTKRAPKGYEEAMLKTYRDVWRKRAVPDEARSIPKSHLKLAGVVQPNGNGALHLRNDIYRGTFDDRWVKTNMPVNWTKRLQRIALAALAAILLLNVPLGIYAWVQRGNAIQRADELEVALGKERKANSEANTQKQEAIKQAQRAEEQKQEAEKQTQIADQKTQEAEEQTRIAEQGRIEADRQRTRAVASEKRAIANEETSRHLVYVADMNLATREFDAGNSLRGHDLINAYLPASDAKSDYRDFYWYFLWKSKHNETRTLRGQRLASVAWSGDGKTLASGSDDNTIKLWDVASGTELRTLRGHEAVVRSVAWSEDGKTLASGSRDGTIKLWDVVSGTERRTLRRHEADVFSVAWSGDGKTLAGGSDNTIKLWDVASGTELRTLRVPRNRVYSVAWSGDGKTLASGSLDQTIKLWDVASGKELRTLTGHRSDVRSVAWSGDGKTLASGSDDNTIKLWDVASGKELRTLTGHRSDVFSVAWSGDGKTLASGSEDQTIKLWDVASGTELRTLRGHEDYVFSVAWSGDGKTLASGSDDNTIKLWDVVSGKELRTLTGHRSAVFSVAWSGDGKTLASGSGDGESLASGSGDFRPSGSGSEDQTIKLWDVASGTELRTLRGHRDTVFSVAWSGDGKTLASGSEDQTIKLWDVASGKELRTLRGHRSAVWSVAWSGDGKTLASGSGDGQTLVSGSGDDQTIKLWDVASGTELRTLTGHRDTVFSVAWSGDGKTLASGSEDQTIKLWDVASGKELRTLTGHRDYVRSVAWSGDGKTLASGSRDGTIKLWDVASGKELRTLTGHGSTVVSVAWSEDGKTLASGSLDNTIKLWDVASGKELRTLTGHSSAVFSVAWSGDGKTLASGSSDKTIILWFAATEAEVREHTPPDQWPQRRATAETWRNGDGVTLR